MDSTPGTTLKIGDGKCWSHNGIYMGKYLSVKYVGKRHDPDPEYTFEHGSAMGLGLNFTEVPSCNPRDVKARKVVAPAGKCYVALIVEGKYTCPSCKMPEEGELRLITHAWDCENRSRPYCQQKGGNRKRKTTKLSQRKRYSRRK